MSSKENLFEIASRKKFRFESARGELTVEQLWGLSLTGTTSLDSIAVALDTKLNSTAVKSFVNKTSTADKETSQKLEIIKHIIDVRQAENELSTQRAEKASQRKILLQAIAEEESKELVAGGLTSLKAKLAALDAE